MNMTLKKQFAQQYANNYVETSVSEATPHKLVEMLYEGAIKNLTLSKVFMQQKNFEKKSKHINQAFSIISNLRDGLDFEKGGEVAENLYDLYDYCYRKTFEASINNDIELVDELIGLLSEVASAWKEMPENIKRVSKEQIAKMAVQ